MVCNKKIILLVLSIRVMQARNVYRQRFPSVESIESWNDHGDSIELEADSLVQVKKKNIFLITNKI